MKDKSAKPAMWAQNSTLVGMILVAALSRLIPHLPNFTAVVAMGLLAGAQFQNRILAVLVPLAALFISDLLIGFHGGMVWVYGAVAVISWISVSTLNSQSRWSRIGLVSLAGSTFFFLVTNFAVWIEGAMYPKTLTGLADCYLLAVPFFGNQIAGDLFFSGVLFAAVVAVRSFQAKKAI